MFGSNDYCNNTLRISLKEVGYPSGSFIETPEGVQSYPPFTIYEAQRWFRDSKGLCIEVNVCPSGYFWELCLAYNPNKRVGGSTIWTSSTFETTYENALRDGIVHAVKVVKEGTYGV